MHMIDLCTPNYTQLEQGKIRSHQLAFETQLLDPELVFRSIGFTNFLSTWVIRQADPRKAHPNPVIEYVEAVLLHHVSLLTNVLTMH